MTKGKHTAPDEANVFQAISECADELKQFALAKRWQKRFARRYIRRSIGNLPTFKMIEQKTQDIERNWAQTKSDIVPGDLLLDRVCLRFGVRFKKDIDSARLAALMEESEIDVQIKSLLREIVG